MYLHGRARTIFPVFSSLIRVQVPVPLFDDLWEDARQMCRKTCGVDEMKC